MKRVDVFVLMLAILAGSGAVLAAGNPEPPMKTFVSPNGDFQFQYPSYLIDCKVQTNNESCSSYMPVCSGTSDDGVACIAYPRDRISERSLKTFGGAAFVIAIVKDAHDGKTCRETMDSQPPAWTHPHPAKINGVEFWMTQNSSAAMSHGEDQTIYRAFHNDLCYELDINTSGVSPMVYDPPPKMYNGVPVQKALQQTLESFKFLK